MDSKGSGNQPRACMDNCWGKVYSSSGLKGYLGNFSAQAWKKYSEKISYVVLFFKFSYIFGNGTF